MFFYFRFFEMCLAISNIDTWLLPPKTDFNLASAFIIRLLVLSCSLFAFIYTHIFFTTSVRGNGLLPTTSASGPLGVRGLINAADGLRADFFLAGFFAAAFFTA